MPKHAEEFGRLEIKACVIILQEDFCVALSDIADDLVLVGKVRAGTPPPVNANNDLAHAAICECIKGFPEKLWGELPFILNFPEGVKQLCVKLEATYGVNFNAMMEKEFGPSEESVNTTILCNSTMSLSPCRTRI